MKIIQKLLLVTTSLLLIVGCSDTPSNDSSLSSQEPSSQEPSENIISESSSESSEIISEENSVPVSSEPTSEEEIIYLNGVPHQKAQELYRNPVYNEEFPDPHMIYDEATNSYWGFGTLGKIITSDDMVNWTYYGNVFTQKPIWGTPGADVWAPDIQYIQGEYMYYYSLSTWGDPNPGIGVASAPHPGGPWVDHGELFRSLDIGVNNSIDANVFVDPKDGRVYCVWGSMRGNFMVELTSDGKSLKDGSPSEAGQNKIHVAGFPTDIGWTVGTYEGAYIIYRNDYYYLFLSRGTCCAGIDSTYEVVVARSKKVIGPYVDALGRVMLDENIGTPVMSSSEWFVGPGHNSLMVDADGNDWIYYHSYDVKQLNKQRVVLMDKLIWDDYGWPYVANNEPSATYQYGPTYLKMVE